MLRKLDAVTDPGDSESGPGPEEQAKLEPVGIGGQGHSV